LCKLHPDTTAKYLHESGRKSGERMSHPGEKEACQSGTEGVAQRADGIAQNSVSRNVVIESLNPSYIEFSLDNLLNWQENEEGGGCENQ